MVPIMRKLRRDAAMVEEVANSDRGQLTAFGFNAVHGSLSQAADTIEELVEALTFYAREWKQDAVDGETGSIGELTPTMELCHDAGEKARTLLAKIGDA
jgi:hypothetical protein